MSKKQAKNSDEVQINDNITSIDEMVAQLEKEAGIRIQTGDQVMASIESMKTGIPNLDVALGIGGLPKGRIIELFGNESSGKTTLSLCCIASCQKQGKTAAFIDAEHALDPDWARKLGVNVDSLLICQPDSGEQCLTTAEIMARTGLVSLIVVDSVAALIPQSEIDGNIGDVNIGAQARLMSQGLRKLVGNCQKSDCIIIFINQLRDKIGMQMPTFGRPEQTPGGRALKFYSSMRLEVKRKETLVKSNHSIGMVAGVKVVKSKVSPPFRSTTINIYFGSHHQDPPITGVDQLDATLKAASDLGILETRGGRYYFNGECMAVGKAELADKFKNDPASTEKIYSAIYNQLAERKAVVLNAEEAEDGFEDEP